MSGKAARSSAVETRRRGDRNVFCPRDTGTSLAQPPDEIDVLVFFEIGESSDAPVHIRADTEVGPVDVTVSAIWMCVVHTFVSFTNGVWMAFPIRDAYGSRDDVRSTRILQLARNPGGADHRICIGGGEPRRSSQLSAELGKARRSRTSDVLVLDAKYFDPVGDDTGGSVRTVVEDGNQSDGDNASRRRCCECAKATGEVFGFVVGGNYDKNLVDWHSDDPFLTLVRSGLLSSRFSTDNHISDECRRSTASSHAGRKLFR
jgi:hypothetical protein